MLREVEQVCDRVGVIKDGVLIAQGPVSQLRGAQVLHIVVDQVDRACDVLERIRYIDAVTAVGDTLVIDAPPDAAAHLNTALVEHGIAVSHLSLEQRSLEDVFFDMTSEGAAEDLEREGERAGGRGSDG
jgi:ABC-2 type transport system ATP-binding protein